MEGLAIVLIISTHPADRNQELPSWKMMNHSILLPREVFIPSGIIFDPALPPTVRMTCIRLYTLTRDPQLIPGLKIRDLAKLVGKSRRTLVRHLDLLQSRSYLEWHSNDQREITLLFKAGEEELVAHDPSNEEVEYTRNNQSKFPEHPSYIPPRIMGYISYQDEGRKLSGVEKKDRA